jgi:hypothetical protein
VSIILLAITVSGCDTNQDLEPLDGTDTNVTQPADSGLDQPGEADLPEADATPEVDEVPATELPDATS